MLHNCYKCTIKKNDLESYQICSKIYKAHLLHSTKAFPQYNFFFKCKLHKGYNTILGCSLSSALSWLPTWVTSTDPRAAQQNISCFLAQVTAEPSHLPPTELQHHAQHQMSNTLSKKQVQHLSRNMNLLWKLLLNLPSLSLRKVTALPLPPPLQSLHLLSWFLPVAMPAVVRTPQIGKTPHTGPNTYQKQTIPAKIF